MDLQKQVCTLEQAKKLKDLGVTAQGAFGYWIQDQNALSILKWRDIGGLQTARLETLNNGHFDSFALPKDIIVAFTVAELGMMAALIHEKNDHFPDEMTYPDATYSDMWSASWLAAWVIRSLELELVIAAEINAILAAS